jgi:hypothetical protein
METTFLIHKPFDGDFEVNSEFGKRFKPVTGGTCDFTKEKIHSGIDFKTTNIQTNGTIPVFNTHNGDVVKCGWSDTMGNYIALRDPVTRKGTVSEHLYEIRLKVDGIEYLFGKYKDSEGVWHDQVNHIRMGKVYFGNVEQVGKSVSFSSRTQMGLTGGTPNFGPHLHLEVLNVDGMDEVAAKDTKIGIGFVTATGEGKYLENPRHHLAKAFPSDFPTTVDTETCGIDGESDYRTVSHEVKGNPNSNKFKIYGGANTIRDMEGGSDTYTFHIATMGANTIIETEKLSSEIDKITFGDMSLTKDGVRLMRSGDNLVIYIVVDETKKITIKDHFLKESGEYKHQIEKLVLSEGVEMDLTGGLEFVGTPSTEYIPGTEFDDTFMGIGGDDIVDGKEGYDTYIFKLSEMGTNTIIDGDKLGKMFVDTGTQTVPISGIMERMTKTDGTDMPGRWTFTSGDIWFLLERVTGDTFDPENGTDIVLSKTA